MSPPNEGEYVTREECQLHTTLTDDLKDRVTALEAEVLGDARTGRPSLRQDMVNSVGSVKRLLWLIGTAIVAAIVGQMIAQYFIAHKIIEQFILKPTP